MTQYKDIAKKIIDLKNADLALRDKLINEGKLSDGYNEEMKTLHNKNAKILDKIMNTIGYPTAEKVGKEASDATWLIIQHAIEQPEFMKRSAQLLKTAVKSNKADPRNLAYLTDRIAIFQDQPQRYGTQFDWDENGNLSAHKVDDVIKVNKRRKAIGLNTLEEQTEVIRTQAVHEKQSPPKDFMKRKREMEEWKKSVGWTK
ncbi:DUF6624 domain-containing protein [uncultured Sphingobacterium sp.]|uniref:DUF6624 domain-containing protein n=1 Tax=uncultured Sphingobacterium sp. TaxID=182688 RepID=UPI0025F243E7|nr:DUF6624 domain-containing protein [uncultured Sphingobacterium sp.]